MKTRQIVLLSLLIGWSFPVQAQSDEGHVQLPLPLYQELLQAVQQAAEGARTAPAGYAMSNAQVQLTVGESQGRYHGTVSLTFSIQVLEEEWVLVPVLPAATAVISATVGGRPMQLISSPAGMLWAINTSGTYNVSLTYQVDSDEFEAGHSLALPLPPTASAQLSATLPGIGLSVAVIPATSVQTNETGTETRVLATVPGTSAIQVTWRTAGEPGLTMSRAVYRGELTDGAITWLGEFEVEMGSNEAVDLELLRQDVALLDMTVDDTPVPIMVRNGLFAVTVQGEGRHVVTARFQVPVLRDQGSPRVVLSVPQVPISRFELTLPGEKEVSVYPASNVLHQNGEGNTIAVVNIPMTNQVTFNWVEAIPEGAEVVAEVRANASIYHMVHADEGVLYVQATVLFDVTRGETSQFDLVVPDDVLINSISSPSGGVVDWRPSSEDATITTVFLDRRVTGEYRFEVQYEKPLSIGEAVVEAIDVPLLVAADVTRQRGMVALLASRELTLQPVREESVTRVGENQLPAFLRDTIEMTIAHTFRYFEPSPQLAVQVTVPERRQGRFDAQVDTLISLGDVTTLASATVEINVKSGSIMELQLLLPPGVNFLSLSAPSLRGHEVHSQDNEQVIDIEFTQDMEGQFRVDVNYERINTEDDADLPVPMLRVSGAEVEQGRVAVEALSAVEVQPSRIANLSTIDVNELPQQLILRTTNPILHAFKYVQVEPTPSLALRITQHEEIEVQAATIDQATYRTLYTRDGFSVTTATFTVRNSRQQFLRVRLPPGSRVWSAFVNGQAETPALANGGEPGDSPQVLINIINSARGFPVELIYTTDMPSLGTFGSVVSRLPRPDMVVTRTRWDLYLPEGLRYDDPDTDMDVLALAEPVDGTQMSTQLAPSGAASALEQPIRITVPTAGLRFSFEKLYANQTDRENGVEISYSSEQGVFFGSLLALLGTLLLWIGLVGLRYRRRWSIATVSIAIAALGASALIVSLGYLEASPVGALVMSGVIAVALAIAAGIGRVRRKLVTVD